jgi:hypothetical protein
VAAELLGRRWIGSELDCTAIVERFQNIDGGRSHMSEIHANKNTLFTEADLQIRRKNGKPLSSNIALNQAKKRIVAAMGFPRRSKASLPEALRSTLFCSTAVAGRQVGERNRKQPLSTLAPNPAHIAR